MNLNDLLSILPLVILTATTVVVLLALAFARSHASTAVLSIAGLAAALITCWLVAEPNARQVTPLLVVDRFSLFYISLSCAAAIATVMFSYDYWVSRSLAADEYYVLLLVATLGAATLVSATHLASLFLGLELLSISLYGLIGYRRISETGLEAAIKYLVLAAVSAAFLLFGLAMIYAATGTMEFARLMHAEVADPASRLMLVGGLAMMLIGFGFKLALAPLHLWAPDVYQGAPAPVGGFIATVSKGAMLAALLRYFLEIEPPVRGPLWLILATSAGVSMVIGSLLALRQNRLKRILGYSSIAHLGYVFVALLSIGPWAVPAVAFYLVTYYAANLAAFGVVGAISDPARPDTDLLGDYHGLAWRRPWSAAVLTVAMLSLAGIPFTAGFLGKFYAMAAGVQGGFWPLVLLLVGSSVIGLYFYLRVAVMLFGPLPEGPRPSAPVGTSGALAVGAPLLTVFCLASLLVILFWLGIYPTPLIDVFYAMDGGVP